MIKKQLFSILPVLWILCLIQVINVNGQKIDSIRLNSKPQPMGRVIVDTSPKYYGGEEARIKFLSENIKYPAEAIKLGIQGKVFVAFTIRTDGSMNDVRILRRL